MDPVLNRWVKADKVLEYVPILSTAVGLADLIQKAVFRCFPKAAEKEGYHKYIKDKSLGDCVLILIPFIGNLAVYVRRSRKQQASEPSEKFLSQEVSLPLPAVLGKTDVTRGDFPETYQEFAPDKQKEVCKQLYEKIYAKAEDIPQGMKFKDPSEDLIYVQKNDLQLCFDSQHIESRQIKHQWSFHINSDGSSEFTRWKNVQNQVGRRLILEAIDELNPSVAASTIAFLVNKCDTMILPMLEATGKEQAFKSGVVKEISRALDQISRALDQGANDPLELNAITKALLLPSAEEGQVATSQGPNADAYVIIGTIINPQLASGDTQFQIQAVRKDGKIAIFCRKQAPGIDKQYLFKKDIGEASITFEIYNNGVLTQRHLFPHDVEAEADELWNGWHMVRDLMTSPYSMLIEPAGSGLPIATDLHGKKISEERIAQLDELIPTTPPEALGTRVLKETIESVTPIVVQELI